MRLFLLCLFFVSTTHAATLVGVPVRLSGTGIGDTLMRDSFVCNDAQLLIDTKEITLSKFATSDISDVTKQISNGNCDVVETDEPVVIKRVVRGYLLGIDGKPTSEILLQVKFKGKLAWTESINLLDSSKLYEDAKTRMNNDLK